MKDIKKEARGLLLKICRSGKLSMAMAVLLVSSTIGMAQQPLHLKKIEVVGLKRLTPEQVIATSGLETGQTVNPDILDAASTRLMSSGLFKKLSYRLRAASDQATVIFEVEEASKNLPVVFENFVWATDDELARAIRQDVPFFDGSSPESGTTADKIAAALQRLLNEKKISGHIEFLPYSDLSSGKTELVFTVRGVKIPVCSVQFSGAAAISEADLIKASQQVLMTDYSRKDISGFAYYTLFPLYRHLGHLRAQFQQPSASLEEKAANCAGGVTVTIPVDEGEVYSWADAAWSGNQALSAEELSAALGMKAGEVADGFKIDKGLKAVRQAYGRKGYMAVHVRESSEFEAQRVSYQFAVAEGPQYHMGNLHVIGVSLEDAEQLKKKWTLAPGAVFDESYVDEFLKTGARSLVSVLAQRMRGSFHSMVGAELKPNPHNQTVDVVITFK